jgi:hypothetical protein
MLVESQLIEYAIQASISSFRHNGIVKQDSVQFAFADARVRLSLTEMISTHTATPRSDLTSQP